ncbi:alpha-amylase family glycosyl hydrolase [Aquirufa rosea]|uniref:T9SS type A sorting domain-containing protein n=1 Tax=Aquirufa rosea TaxID=2509241 RepID=A0A4Q1BX36_9BACT|nr:alpha-amylase family glycosyl hydrolase [Aquirufa rosea]RXK46542.1 T9SS type A sorting domain-containing protein [Aquirufa rosea]
MKLNFNKLIIFLSLLFLNVKALGQVTTQELFPNGENEITIIVDLKKAKDSRAVGLLGKSSDIYLWSGAGSSLGGNAFQYQPSGQSNFSLPFEKGKMNALGNDVWSIKLTPRSFYSVPSGTPIAKIGLLVKNGDGKSQTEDFVLNLYSGPLAVKWLSPSEKFTLTEVNSPQIFRAKFSSKAKAELRQGSTIIWSQANTDSLLLNYTIGSEAGKSYPFILKLESGNVSIEDTIQLFTKPQVSIKERPAGIQDGITYVGDQVYLSLYAPLKTFVYVVGEFSNWKIDPKYLMYRSTDENRFWIDLGAFPPGVEIAYQYYIDGTLTLADPLSDKILDPNNDPFINTKTYPNLKKYPSGASGIVSVFESGQKEYPWTIKNFLRPKQNNLHIYELLIRDFVADKRYATVADSLPYLKRLGINALELMPVIEFSGNDSWGYNPIFYYAPDKAYGTKNDLKYLIDKCHENGIAVILDMVLNQADYENPYVRMYWDGSKPSANSPFFNVTATHPFSVFYDFNHESLHTQWLVDRVCQYWLTEFKVDGFRFDLSKGFTQVNSGSNTDLWGKYDASRIKIWKRIFNKIRSYDPTAYVILEHFAENLEEKELAENGMMLWANAKFDMTKILQAYTNTYDWISYKSRGFPKAHLVNYIESHDEERLMVELSGSGARKVFSATEKLDRMKLGAALFYLIPGPKMIWQFGEWGYDVSINTNGRTGAKPLLWNYLQDANRVKLLGVYQHLANLKLSKSIFQTEDFRLDVANEVKQINLSEGNTQVILIANTGPESKSILFTFPMAGKWYDYFTGKSFDVTNKTLPINLVSGEFHLFVNEAWNNKNLNLVPWDSPSFQILSTTMEMENSFQVYPNPAKDIILLSWKAGNQSEQELSVIDLLGRLVYSAVIPQIPNAQNELNLSQMISLTPGLYIIQMGNAIRKLRVE